MTADINKGERANSLMFSFTTKPVHWHSARMYACFRHCLWKVILNYVLKHPYAIFFGIVKVVWTPYSELFRIHTFLIGKKIFSLYPYNELMH